MNRGLSHRLIIWSVGFSSIGFALSRGVAQCPAQFTSVYYDSGLRMAFVGLSYLESMAEDGSFLYHFVGRNRPNELRVEGWHRVAPSQCEDAWASVMLGQPARIMQFYTNPPYYNAPQWFYDPPDVACAPGGSGDGGNASTRVVPGAVRFDCTLIGAGGGSQPPDPPDDPGGGGMLITETTCHYTAYFDSNGDYLYTELEYCDSYSWYM